MDSNGCNDEYSYDPEKAVNYAITHYNALTNDTYYVFLNENCANFVSQCVAEGGIPMDEEWYSKKGAESGSLLGLFHNNYKFEWDLSDAWSYVQDQYDYLYASKYRKATINIKTKSTLRHASRSIAKGDLVYFDSNGDGIFDHTAIITDTIHGVPYYTSSIAK